MRVPRTQRQRGIAIPLVLGSLTILAALATDFAANSTIQLRLATNARDRLQAEYLAYSGINFLKLELKIERSAKSLFAQLPAGTQGASSGPLCKQYPLSTALLKAIFIPSTAEGKPPGEADPQVEKARMVTAFDTEAAREFLGFEGDFSGECEEEGGKFNLNVFAGLDPLQQMLSGMNPYDRYKEMLTTFLLQPRFKELFDEDQPEKVREVVRNIADWVDSNDQVNEKGGAATGAESSLYGGSGVEYKVKNGKMVTLDEAYLVAGVTDQWFTPLREFFTVYGEEAKINICTASTEVAQGVVIAYATGNPKYPAFNPLDKEMIKRVDAAIAGACSGTQVQAAKVAQEIEAALGPAAPAPGAEQPPAVPPATPPPGTTAATGSSLADMIATEPRYYRLTGIGEISRRRGDADLISATVRATTVIDVKESDPKKWKVLYWHLE